MHPECPVTPFYKVSYIVLRAVFKLITRWEIYGQENLPQNGPLIVVANHLSVIDPPLLGASLTRQITFMAKEELFRSRGKLLYRNLGGFPVQRNKLDRKAIRRAIAVLKSGCVLGMFPEGKRSANHRLGNSELGAAFIAARSGSPILPVGITGTENIKGFGSILRRPRITVTIGQPFSLKFDINDKPSKSQLMQASTTIMGHIAESLPQSYRGIYGHHNSNTSNKMGQVIANL